MVILCIRPDVRPEHPARGTILTHFSGPESVSASSVGYVSRVETDSAPLPFQPLARSLPAYASTPINLWLGNG